MTKKRAKRRGEQAAPDHTGKPRGDAKPSVTVRSPRRTRIFLLGLASGVLTALPFVADVLEPLAWVAMVPFLLLLATERLGRALLFTGMFMFGFVATGCFWLYPLSWIFVLMVGIFFIPHGFLYALVPVVLRRAPGLPLWTYVPLLGAFVEKTCDSLSIHNSTWLAMGYTQAGVLPLAQIAEWTGMTGVSLLVLLVNAVLADLVLALGRKRGWFERRTAPGKKRLLLGVSLTVALLLLSVVFGQIRLKQVIASVQSGPVVLLVQGNISVDAKNDPEFAAATLAKHVEISRSGLHAGIDLVAWPETMPILPETPEGAQSLREIASALKTPLVTGALGDASEGSVKRFANSAFLVSETGEIKGRYDKHALVPFGEYIPVVGSIPSLHRLVAEAMTGSYGFDPWYRRGTEYTLFRLSHDGRDLRFAVPICFEDVLPRMTTRFTQEGADFILLISNENFYHPREFEQHENIAVFRAIETRRPVLRATNTGRTCVVDPAGRVTQRLQDDEEGALEATVPLSGVTPPFLPGPVLFGWLCGLAAAGVIGTALLRRTGERGPRGASGHAHS